MSPYEKMWEERRERPEWTPADKQDAVVVLACVLGAIALAYFGL